MATVPRIASISEARPPRKRRRKRTVVPLAPGARLIGDSRTVHADAVTALIRHYAGHRRDPADRTQQLRVSNGRGGTRTVACPGVARMLTEMVSLLQRSRWWSERELAEAIGGIDAHQMHRLIVAARDDGWLPREAGWPGHDEGADERARLSRSYWMLCVPSWIDPAAIVAAQRERRAIRRARGRGAVLSAVIRDPETDPAPDPRTQLDTTPEPEPERAESAEGSAATEGVDDLTHTRSNEPQALPDPSAPSAALMAALAVLRDLPRLHAHPAYTRVPRRLDPARRGLGHVDLLTTDLVVRSTVITGSATLAVADLAERTSVSRSSLRSSLRSLAAHQIVTRLSRTRWSLAQPDLFAVLDSVADRLGLHAVREELRIAHQEQREKHWERLILTTMMPSDRVRAAIKSMRYPIPDHLVSLRSIHEQADDRCANEPPHVVSSRTTSPQRPTRPSVVPRPEAVEIDRPCLLDLAQLQEQFDMLVVDGVPSGVVTTALTEEIEELAREHGLDVQREVDVAVYRLVGRQEQRVWQERVDLVISTPGKPPLYIEIDRGEKRESRRKLRWAVSQGYDAIWVRWGGSRDVAVVDDGVRVVEPSWRRARRRVA